MKDMTMKHVFYNIKAGDGHGKECAEALRSIYGEDMTLVDVVALGDKISEYALSLSADDAIVICGGDGTINRFVNSIDTDSISCSVLYLPTGTGNDFAFDIGMKEAKEPFDITDYIKGLPTVTVNGKSYKFINGVGYGIDGYCCEVGDKKKAAGKRPNYTSIAITGLLFHFNAREATVIVDGEEHSFKKVWIAPTMYGRCYGGGMIAAPDQKRDSGELTLMVFGGGGRLPTLMAFPGIFKGEHVKSKYVKLFTGKKITVRFSQPTPLQIDGETILGVTEYTAYAPGVKAE